MAQTQFLGKDPMETGEFWCGSLLIWAVANGADASLRALYKSGNTVLLPFVIAALHESGTAELALYLNGDPTAITGISMASSIGQVNSLLISKWKPELAGEFLACWSLIQKEVVNAFQQSLPGQVAFPDYASYFHLS